MRAWAPWGWGALEEEREMLRVQGVSREQKGMCPYQGMLMG